MSSTTTLKVRLSFKWWFRPVMSASRILWIFGPTEFASSATIWLVEKGVKTSVD